ncbi:MAG TPA: ATP-binding protein [Pirellulales bacterium]|nr:ATP-binding protein [Pirellulales bacterium]
MHRSECEFRALAENLPDIVARFDRQLRHLYVNRVVQRITGRPADSFLGKTNAQVGMPDDLVKLWDEALQTVFATCEEKRIEFVYRDLEQTRHFESRLVPELTSNNSFDSILVISRDVTEQVRAQEKVQEHVTELAHATRLSTIGGLVSEISHEINQPLHAIANFAHAGMNVLAQTTADQRPNLFNWFKQISVQASRAAKIIHRAGKFGRKTHSRSSLNINELVRDCLLLFNFDLRAHHVIVRCELTENPPYIWADGIQIQQVLVNLLRNAVEALSENSMDNRQVLVSTVTIEGGIRVSLQDNGCGINAENAKRVFQPFFSTKESMGLGLAVSQSIVHAHRGQLWVEPYLDRGTLFCFTLPNAEEQPNDVHLCI